MSGLINLPHTCPKCSVSKAGTYQEMDTIFGFRNIKPNAATNQSWCRACRKKYKKPKE